MAIVVEKRMWGPCGDPTIMVRVVVRGSVIEKTGGGSRYRETRRVGLLGAIAVAEVLAHLLKGESALGDIGRA